MSEPQRPACAFASFGRAVGSAPTIVFSHSLGADRDMFAPQIEALAHDYHVLAVDTRGHGHAAATPGPYSLDLLTRDLLAAVDAAGVGRFHFCGISMGGLIGLSLSLCAPERLLSLAACNTAARVGSEQTWRTRIEAVRAEGMDGICDAIVPRWFAPGFPSAEPARYQATVRTFRATDPVGYIGCCQALALADLRDQVAAIGVPTLIIGGELDASTPPEQQRWLHAQIAGSELTIFERAAHLSNLDRPEDFTLRLRRFVARAH